MLVARQRAGLRGLTDAARLVARETVLVPALEGYCGINRQYDARGVAVISLEFADGEPVCANTGVLLACCWNVSAWSRPPINFSCRLIRRVRVRFCS